MGVQVVHNGFGVVKCPERRKADIDGRVSSTALSSSSFSSSLFHVPAESFLPVVISVSTLCTSACSPSPPSHSPKHVKEQSSPTIL